MLWVMRQMTGKLRLYKDLTPGLTTYRVAHAENKGLIKYWGPKPKRVLFDRFGLGADGHNCIRTDVINQPPM